MTLRLAQHAGPCGQRPRDLDAFQRAVGQAVGQSVGVLAKREALQQVLRVRSVAAPHGHHPAQAWRVQDRPNSANARHT